MTRIDETMIEDDVDSAFHRFTFWVPEDYKKKVLKALSKEKCPKAPMYALPEKVKRLGIDRNGYVVFPNICYDLYDEASFARRAAINLLEEFGFSDEFMPQEPDDLCQNSMWNTFVQNLIDMPLLNKEVSDIGDPLKKADPSFLKAQLDKIDFLKGAREIKNWGEGKDGQILFGSGSDTYALNNSKLEKVGPPGPTIERLSENDSSHSNEMVIKTLMSELRNTLLHEFEYNFKELEELKQQHRLPELKDEIN